MDSRSPFRRDRDRILYSTEFRRLSGITQVVSPAERFPVHNRLTHSLKVAQVGRSMAEHLLHTCPGLGSSLDPDVVEAACLAHDLGHPPFGHNTERELDRLLRDDRDGAAVEDGFEGNAQSFRVVTKLAVRYLEASQPGLDLTRATLDATLKYPYPRAEGRSKFGYYASEAEDFAFARAAGPEPAGQPSLEAALMDWADDVTYGVHDVEDFFRIGLIPLHRLVGGRDSDERALFVRWMEGRSTGARLGRNAIEEALRPFATGVPGPFRGFRADHHALRTFTSLLIQHCVAAVSIDTTGPSPRLVIDEEVRRRVTVLKALTTFYVIESQSVLAQRYGQRHLIRELFAMYRDAAASSTREDISIFPPLLRERLEMIPPDDLPAIKRLVADLIASMSEAQVSDTYCKLTGQQIGSVIDPVV